MPGIASAATALMIGRIAAATSTIRVGAGGIMLPNHAPLVVAEQFGTLSTLFPNRIDLGLGRAPGTDPATVRALRRGPTAGDDFPRDVVELLGYLGEARPDAVVRAIPGQCTRVPVWILGSSLYGAQLAAQLGLPYAFASHFAPAALDQAAAIYRETFRPSEQLDRPRFILALNVFAAGTDEEAKRLRTSHQLAVARLRAGRPGRLPWPVDDIEGHLGLSILEVVNQALACSAVGSPGTVETALRAFLTRYEPDEVILAGQIHDHSARLRSFEITANILRAMW